MARPPRWFLGLGVDRANPNRPVRAWSEGNAATLFYEAWRDLVPASDRPECGRTSRCAAGGEACAQVGDPIVLPDRRDRYERVSDDLNLGVSAGLLRLLDEKEGDPRLEGEGRRFADSGRPSMVRSVNRLKLIALSLFTCILLQL